MSGEPVVAECVPAPLSRQDLDHLKILSVMHYVVAALALLGIGFLVVHFLIFNTLMSNPKMFDNGKGPPPPPEFFEMFKVFRWLYLVFGIGMLTASVLNFCSARFLSQRTHRMFSLVVAALNCLHMPVGTALGVFTYLVLCRDSVRDAYEKTARLDSANHMRKMT